MKPYRKIILYILIIFTLPKSILGQTHKWVRTNPGGGGAFSTIEAGPTGQIIAGSDLSGAYYSWDFGQSWNVYGAERGLNVTHVCGIGFHPTDEDIFFIGTDAGIYKSVNGGGSLYEVLNSGYITDIFVAPSNTQIVYATFHPTYDSNNGAIYKSTNQGESWAQVSNNSLPNGYRLLELHVSPTNPDVVFVLAGNGRFACGPAHLWKSTNGGINWTRIASSQGEILDVAMHPNTADTLYLSTMNASCATSGYYSDLGGNLYRSTDEGTTWTLVEPNRTGVIWIKRDDPSVIRMIDAREPWPWITSGGTWKSSDHGANWTQISDGSMNIIFLICFNITER